MVNYLEPMYMRLAATIQEKIKNGIYREGDKIPSERELAQLYQYNRMTVKHAVAKLVEEGYLYRIQGKGTFVNTKIGEQQEGKIMLGEGGTKGLSSSIRINGKEPTATVLDLRRIVDVNISMAFAQTGEKEFFMLERIRYADQEPIALQTAYIPVTLFPDADQIDFEKVALYDYMDAKNHMPLSFKRILKVVEVNQDIAAHLQLKEKDYVFLIEYRGYDDQKRLVEFTRSYYRTDRSSFSYYSYKSGS